MDDRIPIPNVVGARKWLMGDHGLSMDRSKDRISELRKRRAGEQIDVHLPLLGFRNVQYLDISLPIAAAAYRVSHNGTYHC